MSFSSSPFSVCCLEGPDDFSRPFPPYPVMSIHYTSPEHATSNGFDIDNVDDNDNDDADIRTLAWLNELCARIILRANLRKTFRRHCAPALPPRPLIVHAVVGYRPETVYGYLTTYITGTGEYEKKYIDIKIRYFGI